MVRESRQKNQCTARDKAVKESFDIYEAVKANNWRQWQVVEMKSKVLIELMKCHKKFPKALMAVMRIMRSACTYGEAVLIQQKAV